MRILICLLALSAVTATPLHAQEYRRNAWGVLFAPTTYRMTEGYRFEVNVSNTSLDVGVFYARFFSPRYSARLEVIGQQRHVETWADLEVPGVPDSLTDRVYSLEETGATAALLLTSDRRLDLSGRELRFSFSGGLTVTGIFDQKLGTPDPGAVDPADGNYGKVGFLIDAGVTLSLKPGDGVFMRFRYQMDESTFATSVDDVDRQYESFGFLVGSEFGF